MSNRQLRFRLFTFSFRAAAGVLLLAYAAFTPHRAAAQEAASASAPKADALSNDRRSVPFDPRIPDCRKQESRAQVYSCTEARYQTYTITLQNVSQQNDVNEILVAIRNMFDPSLKVFLVSSENTFSIGTYPEEFARIEAFVKALDRPKKQFRITYTLTDVDGDKRVGTEHIALVLFDGQRTTMKQGSKIPVATGKSDDGKGSPTSIETQFTYLDVGINIDSTLTVYSTGVRLRAKIEQSSVGPEPAVIAGVSEPVIRQSVLDGVSDIVPGKPILLGSVDITGTTHHLDIVAAVEALP